MTCESMMKRFLEMDANERLPVSLKIHVLFCPRCKKEIASLQSIFQSLRTSTPFNMKEDHSEKIMATIVTTKEHYSEKITATIVTSKEHHSEKIMAKIIASKRGFRVPVFYLEWLAIGSFLFASIFVISSSDVLLWLNMYFGRSLEIPLHLAMGVAITVYAGFFLGKSLESMKKTIGHEERDRVV